MIPIDLNVLDTTSIMDFLNSFDHVFSSCDGVLWEKNPLPGSGEFMNLMIKFGKTIHYVSNNSLRTLESYEAMFAATGLPNGMSSLTLPSNAMVEYLNAIKFSKKIYCITCPETQRILEQNGFQCIKGPLSVPDLLEDYAEYSIDDPDIGVVIFDGDYQINVPKLQQAFTYLHRSDVQFIVGLADRYMKIKHGSLTLGMGHFCDVLIKETRREPLLMAKPAKLFGEYAMTRAGLREGNPNRVLLIGDLIEQDVALGHATGFKTLLVLTTHTREQVMNHPEIRPQYYVESLACLIPTLIKFL